MLMPFGQKELKRREWFIKFTEWRVQRDRGAYWFSFLSTFINVSGIIVLLGMLKFIWWRITEEGITRMDWILGTLLVVGGILIELVKWQIGKRDMEKWKLFEIEQEWRQKNQVMAPFNRELMADMRAICEVHGIKSHFTEVWENKKTAPKGEGK